MATPKIRLKNKLFIKTSTSFSLLALLLACFTSALFSQEYLHINLLAICVSPAVTMISVSIVCKANYLQRYWISWPGRCLWFL